MNDVVPAAELDAAVDALVAQILCFSPRVVGLGKRMFYDQIDVDEEAAYERAKRVMAANAADADAQEGMSAFLEKRAPTGPADWPAGSASRRPRDGGRLRSGERVRAIEDLGAVARSGGHEERLVVDRFEHHLGDRVGMRAGRGGARQRLLHERRRPAVCAPANRSGRLRRERAIPVSTLPGHSNDTLIGAPCEARSCARHSVAAAAANFDTS